MDLGQENFEKAVRKVIEYFSEREFSDKTAETERLALLFDANVALRGKKGPFELWRHFVNLSESKLPADVAAEVENFRQFFRGKF
jgi:hypothetical protein